MLNCVACREGCELKHHCKFLLLEPELQQRNWQLDWERYFQPQAQKMIFFLMAELLWL